MQEVKERLKSEKVDKESDEEDEYEDRAVLHTTQVPLSLSESLSPRKPHLGQGNQSNRGGDDEADGDAMAAKRCDEMEIEATVAYGFWSLESRTGSGDAANDNGDDCSS